MRESRFSEAQMVAMLGEFEAGSSAEDVGRRHGVSPNTIRLWRTKYGAMHVRDVTRLRQLEAENAQMQRIIARQIVEIDAIEDLLRKNS